MANCSKCNKIIKTRQLDGASLVSTLLIAIIPKCSFCVMAYSSAIAMCGGGQMFMESNNWVSYVPLLLAILILMIIAFNPKGRRTTVALVTGLIGTVIIFGVLQTFAKPELYNLGNALLGLSIWINGSLKNITSKILSFRLRSVWQK